MSATYYYNVHTEESRIAANNYFVSGDWYYSAKTDITAKYLGTDHNNIGFWSMHTFSDSISILDVTEWVPATIEKIKIAETKLLIIGK